MLRSSIAGCARRPAFLVAMLALVLVSGCGPASVADASPAIADLPAQTMVPFLSEYVKSCMKSAGGESPFTASFCTCAAAFSADRMTLAEATDPDHKSLADLEKIHPGISSRIKACALAAPHNKDK